MDIYFLMTKADINKLISAFMISAYFFQFIAVVQNIN